MSKKSKKKKNNTAVKSKKHTSKLKIIIFAAVLCVVIGIIVSAVLINLNSDITKIKNELCNTNWIPTSATDASGDEADMAQIYNNNYTSYRGSLDYLDNNSFSFWMTPGAADDGTHSGTYEVADENTVNMYFDDGTNTQFSIKYNDGKVLSVEVNYDGYKVTFTSSE